jgi:glutamate-ammonia-ligase adenylyltransferase
MQGKEVRPPSKPEAFPADLFSDPVRSSKNLADLYAHILMSGSTVPPGDFLNTMRELLLHSPDPDLALNNFVRFSDASLSKASLYNDLGKYPPLPDLLISLFGSSHYFGDILVRDPELFRWLTASRVLNATLPQSYYRSEAERILGMFPAVEKRLGALRRLYRREILRIGARDLTGSADLDTIVGELSMLADALIDASYRIALDQLKEKIGERPETPFAVIGLGKLGGLELNYSSDVDLLFVYDEEGEMRSVQGRIITHHEYFNRLAEKIVHNLSSSLPEGRLYRVDTRLRPESGAGPLSRSLASYLLYYESRGELWERQMLIKARPVAADQKLGETFIRQLRPFVYPATSVYHPAESASRLKARMENELTAKDNIKLQPGGIRDIEFTVQVLQLLHGGRDPSIRDGNTLSAIKRLTLPGYLKANESRILSEAYRFYRTVEHRLQMHVNTQTHELPRDLVARRRLARQMGFQTTEELGAKLDRYLGGVRRVFDSVVSAEPDAVRTTLEQVFGEGSREEQLTHLLKEYGFQEGRTTIKNLRVLLTGSQFSAAGGFDTRVRDAFRTIAGELFVDIRKTPVPDLTLQNFSLLASAQRFPEQFYHQLEQPGFRNLVVRLCSVAPRLVKAIAQDTSLFEAIGRKVKLADNVPGPDSDRLARYKRSTETLASVRYVLGLGTLDDLTNDLTSLAETVVREIGAGLSRILGPRRKLPLAVFALGKFGTRELGLDADLDLLFVGEGKGRKQEEYLAKWTEEFVKSLQGGSGAHSLYEVDARLRPEGKNAPLVVDFSTYRAYLKNRASLWERQSLTRLRFIWGDHDLGRRVKRFVDSYVYDRPLPENWTQTIMNMRRAVETRSRTRRSGILDLKLGAGGMVDIEFLAQMLQLEHGREMKKLRESHTMSVLLRAQGEILPESVAQELVSTYRMYRTIENHLRLTLEQKGTLLPEKEKLEILAKCYNGTGGALLQERVRASMKRAREILLRFVQPRTDVSS